MNAAIEFDPSALPATDAESDARHGRWLRYKADRLPVTFAHVMLGVHLAVFFLAPTWVAALCVIPLAVGSMFVAPINHHHQHLNTFNAPWMNRIYDVVLALQTGIGPYAWVLHHNVGHHVNYLNQRPHERPDESRWTRSDGSQMGRVEYTIDLLLHHQLDIMRLARRHPRYGRALLLMKIPVWGLIAVAVWINPTNAVLALLLPGFLTLAHTAWATYEHHAGLYPTNHMDASVNNLNRIYNFMTCNLGYHTAHHKRPGAHWSVLPEIHEEIKDQIPPHLIVPSFW